ncbi:MAG: cytochrome c-type biosis protein CcmI [Proteobacteria bacterium]|nr:cytochrome c-type biosis protein CcmI [Pseudomonadota bacterium]
MSPQIVFALLAALLVLAVLAIVLPSQWRVPRASNAVDRRAANLEIFRGQLAELERDRNEGLLADADFDQAKSELQRRLLDEVDDAKLETPAPVPARRGVSWTALALLVAIPLAAVAAYALLGNPDALDPLRRQARVSPQQIEEMLVKLETRLKTSPDDAKGWVMLARSYKALGRYPESVDAYRHAGALVDSDPALLADYAESLAQVAGSLEGQPLELIARALKLDPNEPQSLFLAGAAAGDRQDYAAVVEYWGRLLPLLDPASQDGQAIGAALDKARAIVAQAKPGGKAAASSETIGGEVTISDKIAAQAKPDDLLFVFARADEGSRMPLAVLRLVVADLPFAFRLDDTMALPGGKKISEFAKVTIEARIAKAGKAQTSSGDLFGSVKGVTPGSRGVKLVIDQVQP